MGLGHLFVALIQAQLFSRTRAATTGKQKLLDLRPRRKRQGFEKKRPEPHSVGLEVLGPNLEVALGLSMELFDQVTSSLYPSLQLHNQMQEVLELPRSTKAGQARRGPLQPRTRVALVVFWLRHYPSFVVLGNTFRISPSAARLDCEFLLPHLLAAARIAAPITYDLASLDRISQFTARGVSVAVDCTTHHREREGQTNDRKMRHYSGHKKEFVVGVEGASFLIF